MTIVGALDFQAGEQWQSLLLGNFNQFLTGGNSHTWPNAPAVTIPVANWQSTQAVINSTGDMDWAFRWYMDDAATFQIGERRLSELGTWSDSYVTLGNLGPYLQITATNGSISNGTASMLIIGTNRILAPFQSFTSGAVVNSQGFNVGAVSSVVTLSSYLFGGPANFYCDTTATSWSVDVSSMTSSGATQFITRVIGGAGFPNSMTNRSIILPARPLRLEAFNNDAAAKIFTVSVTVDQFR